MCPVWYVSFESGGKLGRKTRSAQASRQSEPRNPLVHNSETEFPKSIRLADTRLRDGVVAVGVGLHGGCAGESHFVEAGRQFEG